MHNNNFENIINSLFIEEIVSLEEIPELDLYMDQVIQLFENKYSRTLRNEDDKVLTKTMINNYAKDKIFMPIKNKKYSKEHLILISLIYQLKGVLSIGDIKKILEPMVTALNNEEEYDVRKIYREYLNMYEKDVQNFKETVNDTSKYVESKWANEDGPLDKFNKEFIMLSSLVNMSNFYRRLAEKTLDQMVRSKNI